MAGIKGGKVKSIKSLKTSLKKGSNSSYLVRIKDEGLTVRMLTEPEEWIEYFEYYDEADKAYYPEVDGVILPKDSRSGEVVRPAKRYLVSAVDVTENKVIPLVLPKSVAGSLMKKYDKYATLTDRDYEITREGSGMDTEYDVTPEPPSKMNLSRFEALDLMAILESQLPGGDDVDDDDEEDEEEVKPKRKPSRAAAAKRRASVPDEDEDDDDDDDEDDEPVTKVRKTKADAWGPGVTLPLKTPAKAKRPARKRLSK